MPRIDRQWREHREHLRLEVRVQSLPLVVIERGHGYELDAVLLERRQQERVQRVMPALQQFVYPRANGLELFRRRQRIGPILADARRDLATQSRHPDHVELVQVHAENRQEFEPLQKRHARVEGLFEHARIEVEPTQLAIQIRQRQGGGRRDGGSPAWRSAPDRRQIRLD